MQIISNKITHNPAVIATVLFLLVASIAASLLSKNSESLRNVNRELVGISVIEQIYPLLEHMPIQRGICTTYLSGQESLYEDCLHSNEIIARQFFTIRRIAPDLYISQDTLKKITTLQERWQRLTGETEELTAETYFKEQTAIIMDLIGVIRNIGELFRLGQSSMEIDYYLADLITKRLPPIFEIVGQIRARASISAVKKDISDDTIIHIKTLINQGIRQRELLNNDISYIASNTGGKGQIIESVSDESQRQYANYIKLVEEQINTEKSSEYSPAVLFKAGTRALNEDFQTYKVSIKLLKDLAQELKKSYTNTLMFSTFAILAAILVMAFMFRRLTVYIEHIKGNQEQLNMVFSTVADGLIIIDKDAIITDFNTAAENIFGYEKNEVIGKNVNILMPSPYKVKHDSYVENYLQGKAASIIGIGRELEGRRKDGSVFPMELSVCDAIIDGKTIFTGMIKDISDRKSAEKSLLIKRRQLEIIKNIHDRFIVGGDPSEFFAGTLPEIIDLTESEFGFIGEIIKDEDQPYLKTYAISNIAWDEESKKFYEQYAPKGLEFRRLDSLFGEVIRTGKEVISNNASNDPRGTGTPPGHPELHTFTGIPLYDQNEFIGMVGLANKKNGYDKRTIELLEPILKTCAEVIFRLSLTRKRQQIANDLERTNSFLMALMENLRAGLMVEDENGSIYAINQPYCDMFSLPQLPLQTEGTPVSSIIQQLLSQFSDPDSFIKQRNTCTSNNRVVSGTEFTLNDGRVIEQHYVPVMIERDDGITHKNHLWSYYDITEHKRVQHTLKLQSDRLELHIEEEHSKSELLRLALQQSSMKDFLESSLEVLRNTSPWNHIEAQYAIFINNKHGHGKALYLAAEHNLPGELHSLCARVPFTKCMCGKAASLRSTSFSSSSDKCHEIRYKGMPEKNIYTIPLQDNDLILGVLAIYLPSDHMHSHDEQNELEQLAEIIAIGISRRHNQSMLMDAKERALAAASSKSQFLATMSHEIRTPMNGVLGMLHLLGNTKLNSRQQRLLDTATASNEMLIKVIDDVLNFSKLEADKLELENITFNPSGIIEETAALMAEVAYSKGLEVICYANPNLPYEVSGDPTRLRQVLSNLLSNSIKFTERGEVKISASNINNQGIRFSVADTGIGISRTEQQRLFKAFSQVDSSHTRKYGGTGLGLAICDKLVTSMGGKLSVNSEKDKGSEFYFEIPLVSNGKKPPILPYSDLFSDLRVIIVADNESQRKVISETLSSWKVSNIDEADSEDTALEILNGQSGKKSAYDLLLLDLNRPKSAAKSLIESVRNNKRLSYMSIICIYSHENPDLLTATDARISKPLRRSDLYNCILSTLGIESSYKPRIDKLPNVPLFEGRQLLLVEDNRTNQEVAREILSQAGFSIDICQNGVEAVQAVQQKSYDAVLMDIQMPIMDGLEATSLIRSLKGEYKNIPIIAMTAHALSGDAEKSIKAGMNSHITKPIDPNALLKELSRWIEQSNKKPNQNNTSDDKTTSLIPQLPGIDTEDGLRRLNGNWKTYMRILKGFCEQYSDAGERLATCVRQKKWDDAKRLVHTIKGSGGNLGAKELYKQSAKMEKILNSKDITSANKQIKLLQQSLTKMINGFITYEKSAEDLKPQSAGKTITESALSSVLLDELLLLLDTDISQAQQSLEKIIESSHGLQLTAKLRDLEHAINHFNTDYAKEIISSLNKSA